MLDGAVDLGAVDFMRASIGLGVFVARAGANRLMLHQAANDGFRGVYVVCFDGPDAADGPVGHPMIVVDRNDARGQLQGRPRRVAQERATTRRGVAESRFPASDRDHRETAVVTAAKMAPFARHQVGFVALANGNNRATFMNCELCRALLRRLRLSGRERGRRSSIPPRRWLRRMCVSGRLCASAFSLGSRRRLAGREPLCRTDVAS